MTIVAASAMVFTVSGGSAARAQAPNSGAPIDVGGLFDLTGSNASVGTNVRNATQMAVDEVNAAGGVNGRKINLDIQDEASDSAKGVTAFNLLHRQKNIDLMFGATFTGAAVAIADVAQKQGVLLYSSSATSPVLTNPTKKYVFAANQTAAITAKGIVTLINSMGAKKSR
jgi:branched-chain amino acid transport system substrate-binding protein